MSTATEFLGRVARMSPENKARLGVALASAPAIAYGMYKHDQAMKKVLKSMKRNRVDETDEQARQRVKALIDRVGAPLEYQISEDPKANRFVPMKFMWNIGKEHGEKVYKSSKARGGKAKGGVVITRGAAEPIVQHELGHADNILNTPGGKLRYGAMLSSNYGSLAADLLSLTTHKPAHSNILAVTGLGLGLVGDMAMLAEEHKASQKALDRMRQQGHSEKDIRKAKKLLDQAYNTYTTSLIGSIPMRFAIAAGLWMPRR